MKTLVQRTLALVALLLVAGWNGTANAQLFPGGSEQNTVLTIHSNGSCSFVSKTVESRAMAEQQVRMMERYKKMSEAAEEGGSASLAKLEQSATNGAATSKPLTDAELNQQVSDMMKESAEQTGQNLNQKYDVKVKKDNVIITTTQSFASVKEMLQNGASVWRQSGLVPRNVRFETDTNGLLRVTLTPQADMGRYLKILRSQWKLTGMKTELKLVFPGKVISSDFPEMKTNATWLVVDAKQDKTLDALEKLYTTPTVITAEAGGINLPEPLESKDLWRMNQQTDNVGNDLPIQDAGPGFIAEAQGITTTVLHVFPAGKDYFKENSSYRGMNPGAVVTAKLFAPRGRTLLAVENPRVLKAVDDQGRSVAPKADDEENSVSTTYSSDDSDSDSQQVELHLKLPQPDARSISEISAEAVAVTAGSWKKLTLTNLEQNATNKLDLSSVLPGAKMVITKLSIKGGQCQIQVKLQGKSAVRRLRVKAVVPGNDQFNCYSSDRQFRIRNGLATRTLEIHGYAYGSPNAVTAKSVALIVRCPEDLKRERVKFELNGLDLL